jgi:hypothetical protein
MKYQLPRREGATAEGRTHGLRCGPQARYDIALGGARDGNSLKFGVGIFLQGHYVFADEQCFCVLL